MNAKDRYKKAVKALGDLLAGHNPQKGQATPEQLLDDIHRYAGELRRKVALLEDQVVRDQQQLTNTKQELERLRHLPSKVEELERTKSELDKAKKTLAVQKDALQRRLSELETIAKAQAYFADVEDHAQVKAKCLGCGLHFTVFTWAPENHNCQTLHCPECGQHNGYFLVWQEEGKGFIFQNVPGRAKIVGFPTPGRSESQNAFQPDRTLGSLPRPSDN